MLAISAIWIVAGSAVGALGNLAAFAPAVWWQSERRSRWGRIGLGALAALAGGWIGTALFGRFVASATAAWVAVLVVVLVPAVVARLSRRVEDESPEPPRGTL